MLLRHTRISVVIVVCLGLQASTFVFGTRIWPFMAYAMYAVPRDAPPRTTTMATFADLADGRRVEITGELAGIRFFAWHDHFLKHLRAGDPAVADAIAQRVRRAVGQPVTAVTLEITRHHIADDGRLVHEIQTKRFDITPASQPLAVAPLEGD